ncbi:KAP family P-loop NTPase fold protein [Thalassospira xiamenensis]|uniref:KAP family P-loop domain-containing protein n=1 Tax=Thalassospira xiamenensis TaxID=220697 RepID=A0A285RIH7_9PROT|nr:P-loop NTPase fold protein [Thalassospira xiamenensis]SOB93508.1 KAP family P-loop domain-containing protein [Thalassospira xiamenensis]
MRLKPDQVPENIGFTEETDLFGYKEFGERLTRVVSSLEQPTTLVLDGPWGSGKSTFLRQWFADLRNAQCPLISFDAFASDFFEDAFIPLSAEILRLTEEKIPKRNRILTTARKSAGKVLKTVAPAVAKVGVRAVSVGLVDYADLKEGFKSTAEAISKAFGDVVEDTAKEAINRALESQSILEKFHKDITELVALYQKTREDEGLTKCPLIFVVDELDRCKPTFALNLVERIKHLFAIEGVIFILVTNLKQLEAAVCGAYGERTNASAYLEKFYDLRLTLPIVERKDRVAGYVSYLKEKLNVTTKDPSADAIINKMLIGFFKCHDVQLRTIERVYAHIQINVASLQENQLKLGPMIAGLCIMRHLQPDLFHKARTERLLWNDVSAFFKFEEWDAECKPDWCKRWWIYLTDPNLNMEEEWVRDLSRSMWNYNIDDPKGLLTWGSRIIDELNVQ